MRVGIDGGSWSNRRGFGRFLREIAAGLGRVDPDNRYVLFLDSGVEADPVVPANFEVRRVETHQAVSQAARVDGRRGGADLWRMRRAAAAESLDVFLFPTVYSYYPLWSGARVVVGVHDTIAEDHPKLAFASRLNEFYWRAKVWAAMLEADVCMTVSEYSKRSIRRVYGPIADPVRVISEAAAEIFRAQHVDDDKEPFVLYSGGISPTKNLGALLRGFAASRARSDGAVLRLVGDYGSDNFRTCYEELRALAAELGLGEELRFEGFVPDAELAALYRQARAFVMPSWDEGFGLPPLEAMASGAAVVYAAGSSLDEIVGEAGLAFTPSRPAELAAMLDAVYFDDALRRTLCRRGWERAREFSWERAARALLGVLEEAARR